MTRDVAPQVLHAIRNASARTGVNFAYLLEQASTESGFNPSVKAKTSSATGLYQFIESTWLSMVKKHGDKYGLGAFADKIDRNGHVADRQVRQQILDLRKDPEKASLLAAELASDNKRYLTRHVGGEIGATELYFAHFMGASGAAGFLNAMKENPLETAADLFPRAARANRNVFYDSKTGEARTLAGVYDFFAKKFTASESVQPEARIAVETEPEREETASFLPETLYLSHLKSSLDALRSNEETATLRRAQNEQDSFARLKTPLLPGLAPLANAAEVMLLAQLRTPLAR